MEPLLTVCLAVNWLLCLYFNTKGLKSLQNSRTKPQPCYVLFLDVIRLFYRNDQNQREEVPLTKTNIAWESDKKYKFSNGDGCEKEGECTREELIASNIKFRL